MENIYLLLLSAIFGALATHIIGNFLSKYKEKKEKKHQLLGELSSFSYEYLSAFIEFYTTQRVANNREIDPPVQNCIAKLTSYRGKSLNFEVRIWQYFKDRKARAAYHKLLNRFEKVYILLTGDNLPPPDIFNSALVWIQEQIADSSRYFAKEAGFNPIDQERYYFVGFRKVTEQDKKELSFVDDDPPWLK